MIDAFPLPKISVSFVIFFCTCEGGTYLPLAVSCSFTNFRPSPPWRWSGLMVVAIVSLWYRWCPQLHHHIRLISRRGAINWRRKLRENYLSTIYNSQKSSQSDSRDVSLFRVERNLKDVLGVNCKSSQLASTPTCDSVWPGVACTSADLRSLLVEIKWICMQVDASFSPFGHPTQVNASWEASINLSLANEIQDMSALKWFFWDMCELARKLANPFANQRNLWLFLWVRLTRKKTGRSESRCH